MTRARTDEEIAGFAEALREILERDFMNCQLEPGKERTVNRIHYRKAVGLNWWDKQPLTEVVFDEFDQRVSLAIRRTPEELTAMEAWLRDRHSEQSLDFQSERVSRRQFGDAFGLDIKKIDREEPEISQLLLNSPAFRRHPRVTFSAAFRIRRATASRF